MPVKRKLPKSIALYKYRSSAKAVQSLSWSERTEERSGSGILRALVESNPTKRGKHKGFIETKYTNEPGDLSKKIYVSPFQERIDAMIAKIKREQKRIDKLTHLKRTPEQEIQLLRKNGVIAMLIMELQNLNEAKVAIDRREENKRLNREAIENGELVRVGMGEKLVPGRGKSPSIETLIKREEIMKERKKDELSEEAKEVFKNFD